jgi:hypothetical protein
MRLHRLLPLCLLGLTALLPRAAAAQAMVPFTGTWSGVTVSADLSTFPVVAVVAEGQGHVTQLGHSTMVSPHTTHVFTGETLGEQIFTAANGDMLVAYCEGFPAFQPDGSVMGTLDCVFTGGTGRFDGVSGGYQFFLVATPLEGSPGFATTATINGSISTVGSSQRGSDDPEA